MQAAQKDSDARRRPSAAPEAYSEYVEGAAEGANEADGAFSAACREVALKDGSRIRLRLIRSDDAPRLMALYDRLSRDSRYQRFFSAMRRLPPDWARMLATVDYDRRLALVAEDATRSNGEVVAVARYEPSGRPDAVEVAFVVEDAWQNRGLGTIMFTDLLRAAEARGHRRFVAFVLGDNRRMLDLIARFGTIERRRFDSGVVEILFTSHEGARP